MTHHVSRVLFAIWHRIKSELIELISVNVAGRTDGYRI